MNYECSLASADRLILDPMGVKYPLCNDCRAPDCTNPIREKTVYVLGRPKTMRLYVVSNVVKQVVACRGYIGEEHVVLPSAQEIIESPSVAIGRNDKTGESGDQSTGQSEEVSE